MIARQTQAIAIRAASLLASVAVTALIVGSQLGIADSYTRQVDAVLAAKAVQQPGAQPKTAARPSQSDLPASTGVARVFGIPIHRTAGVCLYEALASLAGTVDGPEYQRSESLCQRG